MFSIGKSENSGKLKEGTKGKQLGTGMFPPMIADERHWVLIQEAAETR